MSLKKTLLTLLGAGAFVAATYFGLKYATSKHQKIKILEEEGIVESIVKIDTIDLDDDGVGEIIVEQKDPVGGPDSPWHLFRIIDQKTRREILEYLSVGAKLIVKRPVEYVNGYKKLYLITPDNETLDVVFNITRQEYVRRWNKRKAETQVAREEKRASDLEERISQEPVSQEPTTFQQQSTEIADHRQQLQQEETQEEDIFDSNWEEWEKRSWNVFPSEGLAVRVHRIYQEVLKDTSILGNYMQILDHVFLVPEIEVRATKGTKNFDFPTKFELSDGKKRERTYNEWSMKAYERLNPGKGKKIGQIVNDVVTVGSSRNATQTRKIPFYIAYETSIGTIFEPPADHVNFIPRINGVVYLVCGKDSIQITSLCLEPKWGYIKRREPIKEKEDESENESESYKGEIKIPRSEKPKLERFGRTYYYVKEIDNGSYLYDENPGVEYKAKVTTKDGIEKVVKDIVFLFREDINEMYNLSLMWAGTRYFRTKSCMAKVEGDKYHIPFDNIKSIEFFRTGTTLDSAILYLKNDKKIKATGVIGLHASEIVGKVSHPDLGETKFEKLPEEIKKIEFY
ncbi:MAG: hypothetical protein QXW65_02700 [Candidatus Pacearchaeota archaeon]